MPWCHCSASFVSFDKKVFSHKVIFVILECHLKGFNQKKNEGLVQEFLQVTPMVKLFGEVFSNGYNGA